MVLGALLIVGALVAAALWARGLDRYETTGTVIETSPAHACPGDPPLGEVFQGETVAVIGRQGGDWLVISDRRGPGDASFVSASVIVVDGDVGQLSELVCDPSGAAVAIEDTTTLAAPDSSTAATTPSTALEGVETTLDGSTATVASAPGTSRPRSTTTTTRPRVTTTTLPFPVAPPPSTTTTTRPTTTSTTTTTQPTSTTTAPSTTTTTQPTTTTTAPSTTTTTEATTTTTEATTTVPSTTIP